MGDVVPFRRVSEPRGSAVAGRPAGRWRMPNDARGRLGRGQPRPGRVQPLWREVTGAVLRDERRRQRRTLAQVASRAGMSVQYLSELERGRKEASSEMLAAACGSLGLTLAEFATRCAGMLGSAGQRPNGPTLLAA